MRDERGREWTDTRVPAGLGGCWYGVYPGRVEDVKDPDGLGRVKVSLPWAPDNGDAKYEAWARVGTMMAGSGRGTWFIPDKNDEVLVAFAAGNPRYPIVVGTLWNGQDSPPENMDGNGDNDIKSITSRRGLKLTMNDKQGSEVLSIETPGGRKVVLDDGAQSIEVSDQSGNSIRMEASGVTLNASSKLTINASLIEMSAGTVNVNAGMSRFSGVAQSDSVLTNSVVSASYTPGAGNIW